jgi:hypothetical protein
MPGEAAVQRIDGLIHLRLGRNRAEYGWGSGRQTLSHRTPQISGCSPTPRWFAGSRPGHPARRYGPRSGQVTSIVMRMDRDFLADAADVRLKHLFGRLGRERP